MTEIRFITEDEVPAYRCALARGFGFDLRDEDGDLERFLAVNNVETTMAAFDRGHVIATFSSYDLDLTVPGGSIPVAGTTQVTVHPTHRRRGILREMMTTHLRQAVDREQPMAALWASEEQIYGRFGYGVACLGTEIEIPARTIDLLPPPPDVSVQPLTVDEARVVLPAIYERVLPDRPGHFARSADWWEERFFREVEHKARGASQRRFVTVERDGEPIGYVIYRQRQTAADQEDGRTEIVELLALDEETRRALWHFITNIDLYRTVTWWNAPTDDPVFIEADRFRMIRRTQIDTMWLRPLDVPRVLEARSYERDGSIVLNVLDPALERGGRFRLDVIDGAGTCSPSSDDAQVEFAVSELGSLYLGGISVDTLARAGRISGPPEAVLAMHELFRTTRPPFCIEVF